MSSVRSLDPDVVQKGRDAVFRQWRRIVPISLMGVFSAECFVMWLIPDFDLEWGAGMAILDAAILSVLILPGLYVVVLRPVASQAVMMVESAADARFRAVVEATSDSIIVSDQQGRIRFVNRAALELLGYSRDDLERTEITDLVPDVNREDGDREPVEMEVLTKEGEAIPVEITRNVSSMDSGLLHVAVLRDLRVRRRLELYETLLPVCCMCGDIRDDAGVGHGRGGWVSLENYVEVHSRTQFSHTYCPQCMPRALTGVAGGR